MTPRAVLLACSACAGAAGLGIETVLISCAGLSMGYGRSGALGLAVWIAAWAVGAWCAGATRLPARRALAAAGGLSAVAALLAVEALLFAGRSASGSLLATALALAAVAAAALPQGAFLPLLARRWDPDRGGARDVSWLLAANLAGCVVGAQAIGFHAAGAWGRRPAAWLAAALALTAGLVGAALIGRRRGDPRPRATAPPEPVHLAPAAIATHPGSSKARAPLRPGRAGLILGLGVAWMAGVEWVCLRLGVLWLDGMQPALSAVLAASLIALALGAAVLPALVPRDRRGVPWILALALAGGAWPVFCGPILAGTQAPLGLALLLAGPALVAFGALLPVLHRALAGESGVRLGGLLLHEAWGALLGIPLVHFWLVPAFGLGGALAGLSLLGALAFLALGAGPRVAGAGASLALGVAVLLWAAPEPALSAPQLANPAFTLLAFDEDESFAVTVVDDGLRAERTLLTDSFRATAVGDDYLYMRVLGHLPVLLHPAPERVAVLAFGTGTSAGAVSLHPEVRRIDVLELSRAVCDQAALFEQVNHGVLSDTDRVVLHLGDGRRTLARHPRTFDVITMEPLLPDSPFAVYLYTREFYRTARRALAPGGYLCQWVPPHALEPATFDTVVAAFTRAFEWSGVFLFGTQVILLGGEAPPVLDPARFPAAGVAPRAALEELGLEQPAGLAARFVTSGARWPAVSRPLTDADPWIVYRPRRRGALPLADLPLNLRRLRGLEQDLPALWTLSVGVDAGAQAWQRLEAVRLLHRAREAWGAREARLRRVEIPRDPLLRPFDTYREAIAAEFASDPEVAQFDRQVGYVEALRSGFSALAAGHDQAALAELTVAAEVRPGAAEVHLLIAVAAWRVRERSRARAEARRAFELCPRLLETPQGRRAAALGLAPELFPASQAAPSTQAPK